MDLLDIWCGCMTWHALSDYVRWLPPDAALYRSMRAARPAKSAGAGALALVDPLEALKFGTPEHVGELLLRLLNRQEGRDYAESDKDRRGEFEPTLPPGYAMSDAEADEQALAAYMAAILPADPPHDEPSADL